MGAAFGSGKSGYSEFAGAFAITLITPMWQNRETGWWWTQSIANLSHGTFPCFTGKIQGNMF